LLNTDFRDGASCSKLATLLQPLNPVFQSYTDKLWQNNSSSRDFLKEIADGKFWMEYSYSSKDKFILLALAYGEGKTKVGIILDFLVKFFQKYLNTNRVLKISKTAIAFFKILG
jgi:hypothetical protein